jgi:pSer/pThr/pTyr-binding forkhead associated (FHA) protein
VRTPALEEPERDADNRTLALGGVDVDRLKIPRHRYAIQILDSHGQWRDWGPIPANGINIGRARNSADFPGLASMAVRHLRLGYDHHQLLVEDLGSLNGVYVRVTGAVELNDGTRFRVGTQLIEFRRAEPFNQVAPLRSDDEEEFISRDLEPLAYLDLIRPNGLPGLRFPITRREGTVIGRDGRGANVVLTDDMWVSAPHAQVHFDEGRFLLEDLKSRNGTFVQVPGPSPLQAGDVLLAGKVLFRVVDPNAAG